MISDKAGMKQPVTRNAVVGSTEQGAGEVT
jgi:hypothetical protein